MNLCTVAQVPFDAGRCGQVWPLPLGETDNKQTGPFQGVRNTVKAIKAGVWEGWLLGNVDSFQ